MRVKLLMMIILATTTGFAAVGGAQSIYTELVQLDAAESVLVDCPDGTLAAYYYQPHVRDAPPDRSNVVIFCGPETMIGPVYVEGEPHWYLQPAPPLAAPAQADGGLSIYLPLIQGDVE